ncbi:MAG: DUF262 domain-containing protein [Caldilineaceae bacterium]|nr:DUF262 domain-containing protein [Caldilineaceae bacterium]
MKDAQKPDHISLNTLINRLKEGRFVVPDFQREFEWNPWDIRDLMRSIFLDYYIGSLLLWKGKLENFSALSCEPIYGYSESGNPEHIVLDGQQRLTAIYYAFLAPDKALPNRSSQYFYYVQVDKFMAEEYDSAFNYDRITWRWSKLLNDRQAQFEEHIFPLSVVGAGGWELPNWVQGYEQYWREIAAAGDSTKADKARHHSENAKAFGEHLKGITEQYQVSYIELDRDLEVAKVCDIFTQINSRGIRLDVFDLINALLKPKGLQLKHMWRKAESRLEFVGTGKMNVYILQVMSILRQNYCSPKYLYYLLPEQERTVRNPDGTRRKEVLVPTIQDFEGRWNDAVGALEDAIKLLRHPQEFGAISADYLPYVSILPVFAALQAHIRELPAPRRLDAQRKIRHWYWASVFMNRYSGSVESTSARDFLDVKSWIVDDTAEPSLLLDFKTRFRTIDLRKEVKRGTSVYNGIFNLFVLQEARDWMTGNVPLPGDLDDHHIVPASWGAKHAQASDIHTILNRAPLTADTNRNVISDRLPNAYLPELIQENGEKLVRSIFDSHFISSVAQAILMRDPFTPDDFQEFLNERQRTIQEAIETLLIKERIDLPLPLRDLDERIEQVELGLRTVIASELQNDSAQMPTHITQKVEERIQSAMRRDPSLGLESDLRKKLEYSDLRELQDIIMMDPIVKTVKGPEIKSQSSFL